MAAGMEALCWAFYSHLLIELYQQPREVGIYIVSISQIVKTEVYSEYQLAKIIQLLNKASETETSGSMPFTTLASITWALGHFSVITSPSLSLR